MVLVGESDGNENEEWRDIVRSRETFEKLTQLVYHAFETDEEIWLEVGNRVELGVRKAIDFLWIEVFLKATLREASTPNS